jgi:alpha-mannosidase
MLPKSALTQLVPDRISQLRQRLAQKIWHQVDLKTPITWAAATPSSKHCSFAEAQKLSYQEVQHFPHVWGQMWEQGWFQLTLPESVFGQGFYLNWDDEAEVTLYADGMPWYGIDAAHHYAPLPETAQTLWLEGVVCRSGIWVKDGKQISPEGSTLRSITIWRRDDAAWDCYWDLHLLFDLMALEFKRYLLEQAVGDGYARNGGYHEPTFTISPLYRRVLQGLDRFADVFDRSGVTEAAPLLKELYQALPAHADSIDAILTGHAHIDLVWLWPERVGEAKAVHTFATVNRLMSQDNELHFGYSQPASYDAVGKRSPELLQAVQQRMAEGRWEATGATDVESDTQLPCGEALARSFMIGQERFEALRGERATVMWLPNVFGYSGCLPQIMQQTGVKAFYTSKTAWSAVTRFPHSSFVWAGTDGSEVLVHLGQEAGYNGGIHFSHMRDLEEKHQQVGIHNEVLVPTGYGDGGGGPTEEMLERAKRLKNLAGLPRCRWGRIEDFFERLADVRDDLPQWQGEIYLEYHRGVQTTHGELKANFRAAERALQNREAAHAVQGLGPIPQDPWRRVIFVQFHDAIPGSSIREVTDELNLELSQLIQDQNQAAQSSFEGTTSTEDFFFNQLPFPRRCMINGRHYDLPALSTLSVSAGTEAAAVFADETTLRNEHLEVHFNKLGEITHMNINGEPIAQTAPMNQLWVYPDHPHNYPAWDIDRGTLSNGIHVTELPEAPPKIVHSPGLTTVIFIRRVTERSTCTIHYRLEAGADTLAIAWDIDWQDPEMLVKVLFPTAYNGRMARFGAPFGSVLRPQQAHDAAAEAMWEVPASRWGTVSDDGEREGFAVITEAKYGFTARNGCLGLSLLRSAEIKHAQDNLNIRTLSTTSPYSDLGPTTIRAAIGAFDADLPRSKQPAARAESLFQPVLSVKSPVAKQWGFELTQGESLLPTWTQPLDDGSIVVRCHEFLGQRGKATLHVAADVDVALIDLSGNPVSNAQLRDGQITFTPYALFGIHLQRS